MVDSFRIQNFSFKIRVSDADGDGGVPVGDGGLRRMLNVGFWIEDDVECWILDVGW
jgi:hypothetical protein